ncbi:MAG: (E)-4-hydroxy-3-methylbut-2-enyl-diphosphate synthase [Muribaculaceae bacterium]|nr:(E)-4-hydroxy-3-methylbut-2-enyl-diphosphate synthase [Muribaculaceae bacterium]
MTDFSYRRRKTSATRVGNILIGGDNPIVIQSMTSTSTMDTPGSVEQIISIVKAGGQLVRLTAQGVREADNLAVISRGVAERGVDVPLVADIHFNPAAAFAAVRAGVAKVRINPGNFVDPGRTFRQLEYTDEEYAAELRRLADAFVPFLEECRQHGTAIRLGVNHGSLSDRIMSRYGDTPEGMVESAMEFLRVAARCNFNDIVISIKASNVVVMTRTVSLLAEAMDREGFRYPLHLGVTEAGDGEDGRVKSAVGIGSLLVDGLGDTIRVSLSEDPASEIPEAARIVDYIGRRADAPAVVVDVEYRPLRSVKTPLVASFEDGDFDGDCRPDLIVDPSAPMLDAADVISMTLEDVADVIDGLKIIYLTSSHPDFVGSMRAALSQLATAGVNVPVIGINNYSNMTAEDVVINASIDMGTLLLEGSLDGIAIGSDTMSAAECCRLAFGILQATRLRITRSEFIACPGCGRTLFDLRTTLQRVRRATGHLKGLKIGVMGCIVNGPGEMADADYGYVGAAAGKVSLYKGKTAIERNIPEDAAIEKLIDLLKDNGDWVEPTSDCQ